MNKSELEVLLKDDATPIYKLEQELGMPKTTLQKAINGKRDLPKKWALKLKERMASVNTVGSQKVEIQDLTKPTNVVNPTTEKPQTSNITIAMPSKSYHEILKAAKGGASKAEIDILIAANGRLNAAQVSMIKSKIKQ